MPRTKLFYSRHKMTAKCVAVKISMSTSDWIECVTSNPMKRKTIEPTKMAAAWKRLMAWIILTNVSKITESKAHLPI